MTDQQWSWAPLDAQRLALVEEAETALGADYVLVYVQGTPRALDGSFLGLVPADLDERQLDRLRGIEEQLGAVAVAYRSPRAA